MSAWPPQNQLTAFFYTNFSLWNEAVQHFTFILSELQPLTEACSSLKVQSFVLLMVCDEKAFTAWRQNYARLHEIYWRIYWRKISWFWAGQAGRTEVFMEWLLFTDLRIARAEAYPPPKNKSNWTIISSFHLLVYIFIYLKILHLKSVSWVVFMFQFAVMWLCRQPNPRVTLIFHWN